jgi:hypothetical protein
VDSQREALEGSPVSRAELSLEISRLVPRLLSGENIDVAGRSEELAARFPDLGMTAEMIGSAIERAATMVDLIRHADEPSPPASTPPKDAEPLATANGYGNGHPADADVDEMLAFVSAGFEGAEPDFRHRAGEDAVKAPEANGYFLKNDSERPEPASGQSFEAPPPAFGMFAKGAMATLRRALFRNSQ